MVNVALLIRLGAKPGKEAEMESFLGGGPPAVQGEPATTAWFALRLGPSTFGIFDAFPDESGRQAHLSGKVAAALMARAADLFRSHLSSRKWTSLRPNFPGLRSANTCGCSASEAAAPHGLCSGPRSSDHRTSHHPPAAMTASGHALSAIRKSAPDGRLQTIMQAAR